MANQFYSKLFYDLDAAKSFGKEIDYIADQITVPAGKLGRPHSVFGPSPYDPFNRYESTGEHYAIRKDVGIRSQDTYYVEYNTGIPNAKDVSHADVLQATRQATEYLNQKYNEIGPDTGRSLV